MDKEFLNIASVITNQSLEFKLIDEYISSELGIESLSSSSSPPTHSTYSFNKPSILLSPKIRRAVLFYWQFTADKQKNQQQLQV
jgi:hypothetical protein